MSLLLDKVIDPDKCKDCPLKEACKGEDDSLPFVSFNNKIDDWQGASFQDYLDWRREQDL